MGCYSVGCALATLVRGICFFVLLLLLLLAQVMPTTGLPTGTMHSNDDKDMSKAVVAAPGATSNEMAQADSPNFDKRSVNTFPYGSAYYMSTKNHYELFIESREVKGIRAQPRKRGALMMVQTLPCQYNKTRLAQDIGLKGAGRGNLSGSCSAVSISSQMGKETLYICMSSDSGRVYTANSDQKNEECEFIEQPEGRFTQYYSHLRYKNLKSQNKECEGPLSAVKSPESRHARHRRKKDRGRQTKSKGKRRDPCALWYLEIDKNGKIRKGRKSDRSKSGAFFQKLDPNNTFPVSPQTPSALPGGSFNVADKSKTDKQGPGQPGKAKSRGRHSKGDGRKGRPRRKGNKERRVKKEKGRKKQRGGSAPFEVRSERRRRPQQTDRSRKPGPRKDDNKPVFARNAGNLGSGLFRMALTSTEYDEGSKRTHG